MTIQVARLVQDNEQSFNLINIQIVEILFQRSPSVGDPPRGIEGLAFRVLDGSGAELQARKVTAADGRARVPVLGGRGQLQILNGNAPVTAYEITLRDEPIEPLQDKGGGSLVLIDLPALRKGIARRLRMLGYPIGDSGPEGNGVEDPPQAPPPKPSPPAPPPGSPAKPGLDSDRGLKFEPGPIQPTAEGARPISRELDRAILDFEADESLDWNGQEGDIGFLNRLEQKLQQLES